MRALYYLLLFWFGFVSIEGTSQGVIKPPSEGFKSYKFIPNKGQWPQQVNYKADIQGGSLWMLDNAMIYKFSDHSATIEAHANPKKYKPGKDFSSKFHAFKVEFADANAEPSTVEKERTSEYYNYYLSPNPDNWASKVYGYKDLRLQELYNGIDVHFYSAAELLKYDLIIEPNADPGVIQMDYTGVDKLSLKNGHLHIDISLGKIVEQKPFAYQEINGNVREVPCEFVLDGNTVSFKLGEYDPRFELVIDPTLIFSTSSGSFANNFGMTATYDNNGNLFSAGTVFDDGFPYTTGAYDTTYNGAVGQGLTDAIITKYTNDGTAQIYSTYIGGTETETIHSLIINDNAELFFFGITSSTDFPITTGAYDNTFNGGTYYNSSPNGTRFNNGTDIYIGKLSDDGTALLASTYVGGSANDGMNYNFNQATTNLAYDSLLYNYGDQFRGEVMVDSVGNCYIATCTKSSDFPIVNGFGTTISGGQAGVVMKLDANLQNLVWSTYIDGDGMDAAYSIKLDDNGVAYVTGGTASTNLPLGAGTPYQNSFGGGIADAFVCKISPNGSTLQNLTYLGTNQYDQAYFIEVDRFGMVHLVGQTFGSSSWPITAGVYSNPGSGQFITSLTNDLSALNYSTLFGNGTGQVNISPAAFLVDYCGNIYVSGWGDNILTGSGLSGMPVTSDAIYPNPPNNFDFYLIVLEREATGLLYGSYYGGNLSQEHVDGGTSRFDPNGLVYQSVCAGCQNNDDFPSTPGAWSATNNSTGCNNGMFVYDFEIMPVADFTVSNLSGCAPLTIDFTNNSLNGTNFLWDFGNGDTTSIDFSPTRTYNDTGTFYVYLTIEDTICLLNDTALQIITVYPELSLTTSNDTVICDTTMISLWASSSGDTSGVHWSTNSSFTDTLNNPGVDSVISFTPMAPGYYYVQTANQGCSKMDSVYIDFTAATMQTSQGIDICVGDDGQVVASTTDTSITLTYDWYPDSIIVFGDGTNAVTVAPTVTQYVYVTATASNGCIINDSVLVTVSTFGGNVNAYVDQDTIPIGSSTGIHAGPSGSSFDWLPPGSGDIDDPFSGNSTVTPTSLGQNMYVVEVSNGGCLRQDTVYVWTFEYVCEDESYFIPDAFTPNGDGANDKLYVRGENLEEFYFTVYDRWGEKMFETDDINEGWDGTYKGRPCDPAVYVYYLEGVCFDGRTEIFKKGDVTLIR